MYLDIDLFISSVSPCYNWHSRDQMWESPELLCLCVCVSQCFLAECTASWEVGCSVPVLGTYSSLSPRQLTTGCSTVTPAITCTRACGGTVCREDVWRIQTALVRFAVCFPQANLHLYLLLCWQPDHDLTSNPGQHWGYFPLGLCCNKIWPRLKCEGDFQSFCTGALWRYFCT